MKLMKETREYLRKLSPEDRRRFLDYLGDADANIRSEVEHLDNELGFVHHEPVEPNESE